MADDSDDINFDKPVEKGKNYKVEIEDIGSKGDGIARIENFVVFVPKADIGDKVEVEITSVGRRFAFGEIVEEDIEIDDGEELNGDEKSVEDVGSSEEDEEIEGI